MANNDIKKMYKKVLDKDAFKNEACESFRIKPSSLETNWISKGYIPDEERKLFIEMLKKYSKKQLA